ncbi:hypothetical protein Tco_1559979 [Tanacetum coccineum]
MDAALETRWINQDLRLENGNDTGGGDGNGDGNGMVIMEMVMEMVREMETMEATTVSRADEADERSVLPRNEIQKMETEL